MGSPADIWRARLLERGCTDSISVRNLQCIVPAGVDVWGRKKEQPVLVTSTLHLAKPFDSAASADSLDSSTVHYGILSKDILRELKSIGTHVDTATLAGHVHAQTVKTSGNAPVEAIVAEVFYPKGSMLGDGAGWTSAAFNDAQAVSCTLYLRNVRVPCLIGVNANERLQKQPLIINLWIERVTWKRSDDYPALEKVLVEVICAAVVLETTLTYLRQSLNPPSKR